jgi:aspartate carbamoyltransferase catalytic subunit
MRLKGKDILDMASLSREEIEFILKTAGEMKEISKRPIKKAPALRGKTVILFFQEPSTRTRMSFDIAAKRLSADCHSISASSSSMVKGETLMDTALNLQSMNPDVLVIRHSCAGAPHMIARAMETPVINAGDGKHAHPSQALLDMMTVYEKKKRIEGLKVAIIGDIAHSRVARSDIEGFSKLGARVTVSGPPPMIPPGIEALGASVSGNLDDALRDADVVMALRIQKERQKGFLMSSEREYAHVFGLTPKRLEKARPDAIIMHPGPMNRGVEISPETADGPASAILDQVENGVAVRMALILILAGEKKPVEEKKGDPA